MHVSDVKLTCDDQSGDRYVAQACQRGRFICPFQVFFWPQVVRVCREQRSQPIPRAGVRRSGKPWIYAAPVLDLLVGCEDTSGPAAATAGEMLGKAQPAPDR